MEYYDLRSSITVQACKDVQSVIDDSFVEVEEQAIGFHQQGYH